MRPVRIGIIGDFNSSDVLHTKLIDALEHAGDKLETTVITDWLATDQLHPYEEYDGIFCGTGNPYGSLDLGLRGIQYARENGIPLLGTCGGFQHAVLEFARNAMNIPDAAHAEYRPESGTLFVTPIACSIAGQQKEVLIDPGSYAARIFGKTSTVEAFYCNYGLSPDYQEAFEDAGFRITGRDENGEARIVELPEHPFYIATLFVPQANSSALKPHPLIVSFVNAAAALRSGSVATFDSIAR
jgi:CTP synthase (UTP-ammonia lyase)